MPTTATMNRLPGESTSTGITDRDRFFFDLNGFLILRGAIDADRLKQINDKLDELMSMDPPLKTGSGPARCMPIPTPATRESICSRFTRRANRSSG